MAVVQKSYLVVSARIVRRTNPKSHLGRWDMTKTVISSNVPYCTPHALAGFHDWRPIARLVQDSDNDPQETFQQFLADPSVLLLLQSASGEVEDALLRGTRYTADDLQALDGTNAGAKLAELVA